MRLADHILDVERFTAAGMQTLDTARQRTAEEKDADDVLDFHRFSSFHALLGINLIIVMRRDEDDGFALFPLLSKKFFGSNLKRLNSLTSAERLARHLSRTQDFGKFLPETFWWEAVDRSERLLGAIGMRLVR